MGRKIWTRRSKHSNQFTPKRRTLEEKSKLIMPNDGLIDDMLADWHKYLDRHKDYPNKDYLWQRWIKT